MEDVLFFILERNHYVKKEIQKLLLASLLFLAFSLIISFTSLNLNEVIYTSYLLFILFLSRNSIYLAFPSLFSRLKVFEENLQLKIAKFASYTKDKYLKTKKILLQRRISEREALKLSRNAIVNYLKNEKKFEAFSKSLNNLSAQTLAKDKDKFIFLFKEKNLEFMVMVNRISKEVIGPLLIPSAKQLSYALSKYFELDLKVVNMKYTSFGVIKIGLDNNKGIYYEGTLNLINKKLKLDNAFLSYKFFLTNYEPNLILEDMKRIDNFKFEVIYSDGKEKYFDIVDVSNIKKVVIQKKN